MDPRIKAARAARFPLGRDLTLDELDRDPYPVFDRLRRQEPISWVAALDMWYVVGYEDVRSLLSDPRLTTASPRSTIVDTFGAQMLSTEGAAHDRYRAATRQAFAPNYIRRHLESAIGNVAALLIRGFESLGRADLRAGFAGRLPIQVILLVCGLPAGAETRMRGWYYSFEAALANFTGDVRIREAARQAVDEFHALLDDAIGRIGPHSEDSLLAQLVKAPAPERLSDEEIKRNLAIIFFGGISTVEALLLNTLWALFEHPQALERVRRDHSMLPRAIAETMRWLCPVQSATRHITDALEWRDIEFSPHDTVNCILGAANRDPAIFSEPHRFDMDRENSRRHFGFAAGAHACLGSHLAKAEVRIGLGALFARLPNLRWERPQSEAPRGYEFRRPRRLTVSWDVQPVGT